MRYFVKVKGFQHSPWQTDDLDNALEEARKWRHYYRHDRRLVYVYDMQEQMPIHLSEVQ